VDWRLVEIDPVVDFPLGIESVTLRFEHVAGIAVLHTPHSWIITFRHVLTKVSGGIAAEPIVRRQLLRRKCL